MLLQLQATITETPYVNTSTPATIETSVIITPVTPAAADNTTTKKKNTPGFEITLAIFGLLLVVYIVRKNK